MLAQWIDDLGTFNSRIVDETEELKIKSYPDFNWLEDTLTLGAKLSKKLKKVIDAERPSKGKYIAFETESGAPVFLNENAYDSAYFPEEKLRVLSIFRYGNIIKYFSPYFYLISNWDEVLTHHILLAINASSKEEYTKVCLSLITSIKDTHAELFGSPVIDSIKGLNVCPLKLSHIEGKLVVTGIFDSDTKLKLKIGDEIKSIDGIKIDSLIRKYLPFTSASNYAKCLDMAVSSNGFILRSNSNKANVCVSRNSRDFKVIIKRMPFNKTSLQKSSIKIQQENKFKIISDNIGYIDIGQITKFDLTRVSASLRNTKGLIIDLRHYPSLNIVELLKWFKPHEGVFAKVSTTDLTLPGRFLIKTSMTAGGLDFTVIIIAEKLQLLLIAILLVVGSLPHWEYEAFQNQ